MAARDQRQYSLYLTTGEKAMLDALRVAEGDVPDLNKMIRRLIERAYDTKRLDGKFAATIPPHGRQPQAKPPLIRGVGYGQKLK